MGSYPDVVGASTTFVRSILGQLTLNRAGLDFHFLSAAARAGGDLQILEIAFDPAGNLSQLAVDFRAFSANIGVTSPIYGQLRYNSAVPIVPPSYLRFQSESFSAHENDGVATITVTRNGSTVGAVSVDYATLSSGGSATANLDYAPVSGTLTWADGDAAPKSFIVPIARDDRIEGDETVLVQLSGNPLGQRTPVVLTIIDDTPRPGSVLHLANLRSVNGNPPQELTRLDTDGLDFGAYPPDAKTTVRVGASNYNRVPVGAPGSEGYSFLIPISAGVPLLPGRYPNTTFVLLGSNVYLPSQYPFQSFEVLEANYDAAGNLLQFAANFESSDTASGPPVFRGEIRFHSAVPIRSTVRPAARSADVRESAGVASIGATRTGDASAPTSVRYCDGRLQRKRGRRFPAHRWHARSGRRAKAARSRSMSRSLITAAPMATARFSCVSMGTTALSTSAMTAVLLRDNEVPTADQRVPGGSIDAQFRAPVTRPEAVEIAVDRAAG